jgi:tRNA threonylcarbamoyladenosine biosynthesis protein TsaE
MSQAMVKVLSGEQAMVEFGRQLGKSITAPILIFLTGDLGAGKTTLCRGILGAFGHKGPVKSPTYTLVEPYQFGGDGLVCGMARTRCRHVAITGSADHDNSR